MSPVKKTDAASAEEQSAVRARRASNPELTPASRDARIEQKLALAESLIAALPLTDTRRHLLHIAVLRRDETLLEGILSTLK